MIFPKCCRFLLSGNLSRRNQTCWSETDQILSAGFYQCFLYQIIIFRIPVHEALLKAGREDLIGFDEKCLIRPRKLKSEKSGKPQARTQSGHTKPKHSGNSAGNSNGAKKKSTGRKPIRNVHKKKQK